ncbi:DUF434 domain-containing protein [Pontibacter sp. G13]|uniref:DUF434 domain-containing protein n=1 Tax=Pontibacter sp. G13 TaxID=3074898 RepID=UPI002889E902|nr:DUF434 domain-containing protein [Pontibacter sp. G13]WNJ21066.1 DUF434 domain-containing protein [Pontibacter sp. G13]
MSKQKHRGKRANDDQYLGAQWWPTLNLAVTDLSWLLSRGYTEKSALKLVGDRYRLNVRQRQAISRASCSDLARDSRVASMLSSQSVAGSDVVIDGYNLLITVEAALAKGWVILSRDGCYRDIASVHGTYRRVEETFPALRLIGHKMQELGIENALWFLDKPVSNSGRLKTMMRELAEENGFNWDIRLVNSPDKTILEETDRIPISSDGWVIDHRDDWFNLAGYIIEGMEEVELLALKGTQPLTLTFPDLPDWGEDSPENQSEG